MSRKSHLWNSVSLEVGPGPFRIKNQDSFFLLCFVRVFVQRLCPICTANKNVIAVRAHGEMLHSKVKEIIHLQI